MRNKNYLLLLFLNVVAFEVIAQTSQADFKYSVNRGFPLTLNFTDLSTNRLSITAWSWNFGDGTPPVQAMPNISHTYATEGNYTVTLTVNWGSTQNVTTKTINVTTTLGGLFTTSKNGGSPPLTVDLDCSISTGVITGQVWTITPALGFTYVSGDQSSISPSVQFTTPADYNISVTVVNSSTGASSSSPRKTISVGNKPVVDFSWTQPTYVNRPIYLQIKPNINAQVT